MALTLDTTLGGLSSNSYVDVAYCDDYWNNHYSYAKADQWAGLSATQKVSALIQACNVLERCRFTDGDYLRPPDYFHSQYNRYSGVVVQLNFDRRPLRSSYRQKLQFPRSLDYMDDGTHYIPEPVKMAQCEQAAYLLAFDESVIATRLQGVTQDSVGAGDVRTSQNIAQGGIALAPMALEFLSPYFFRSNAYKRA